MGTFADKVGQFAKNTTQRTQDITERAVGELTATIIDRTPIGDNEEAGPAKNGWQIQVIQQGFLYRIYNTVPYIGVLEYGEFPNPPKHGTGKTIDGFSTQAPAGMVRISVAEFPQLINNLIRTT